MINISEALPVRLYEPKEGQFRNVKNMRTDEEFNGTPAIRYKQQLEIGKPITLQVETDETMVVYINDIPGIAVVTNITPIGWVGGTVLNIQYTPVNTTPIIIRITFQDEIGIITTYQTECLWPKVTLINHIKIEYYNTVNKFSLVFGDEGDKYRGVCYVPAIFNDPVIAGEIISLDESDGNTIGLKTTVQNGFKLVPFLIPQWVIIQLSMVLGMDRIVINDISYIAKELISPEQFDNTNIIDGSVDMLQVDWGYKATETDNIVIATELVTTQILIATESETLISV